MYDQTNLVKVATCYKNLKGNLLDVFLNLTNCRMLKSATLRPTFIRLAPKTVKYRSYKNFNETVCLHELDQKLIHGGLHRSDDLYLKLAEIFSSILDKDAPIKSKQIRGNQAPFMNKSLSKIIMQKSKVRNKKQNFLNYIKVTNKCK